MVNEILTHLLVLGIVVLAILIPMEIYKWIKDRYWFGTWDWNKQKKCRFAMDTVMSMSHQEIFHGQADYMKRYLEASRKAIRMAYELTSVRKWTDVYGWEIIDDYDQKFDELIKFLNEHGLKESVNIYRSTSKEGKFHAYGHRP